MIRISNGYNRTFNFIYPFHFQFYCTMEKILVLIQLFSTLFMTGLIWFVQIVHYPLYQKISGDFVTYEKEHTILTSAVTAPVMLLELMSGVVLFFVSQQLLGVHITLMALLAIIWVSTIRLQMPIHQKLCLIYDKVQCEQLVKTNWIRTVAWSLRSLIWIFLLYLKI